ncbi:MAG TPA: flagellar basal body protein [Burkholderiaceae bacterium]|nr:flagellar basal body protein [Burkholderiaceae bacterium]
MNALPTIAQSGLQAAQTRLGSSAHNIANQQTDGFKRQTVTSAAAAPGGGVVVSISQAAQTGADLPQDVVDQMSAKHAFVANVQVLKVADRMMGSLLDIKA